MEPIVQKVIAVIYSEFGLYGLKNNFYLFKKSCNIKYLIFIINNYLLL